MGWRRADGGEGGGAIILIKCHQPFIFTKFIFYFWISRDTVQRLFGTDPDRNRALEETPRSWTDSLPSKMHTLRDQAQTQVWSEQVWLDKTFISQGSRSWGKLAVETWRVKTELIIITILHIIITTKNINLKPKVKTIAPKILAHTQCINKYWKYTQIFAAQNQAKS